MELEYQLPSPQWSLEGLNIMLEQLSFLKDILSDSQRKGKEIEEDYERIRKLTVEIELIREIMESRYDAFSLTNVIITMNHAPQMVRPADLQLYESLSNGKPLPHPPINIEDEEIVKRRTEDFKINFTIPWKEQVCDILFEFLLKEKFIAQNSNNSTFLKLLQLQAIPFKERIVWIDKHLGKPTIKTLTMLFNRLITRRTNKRHGTLPLSSIITQYFKPQEGEFNTRSIDTNASFEFESKTAKSSRLDSFISEIQKDFYIY